MKNADEILSGIYDGAVYWGPLTAIAPDGFNAGVTQLGYSDLGYVTEDGPPEISYPAEAEATAIRVWQNAKVVRTIRTPSGDPILMTFTLAQTNSQVIRFALGVEFNEDGSYTIDANTVRPHGRLIVDVVTDFGGERYYAADAVVTAVEPRSFPNDGSVAGWAVTVAAPAWQVWPFRPDDENGIEPPVGEVPFQPSLGGLEPSVFGEPGVDPVDETAADVERLVVDAVKVADDFRHIPA